MSAQLSEKAIEKIRDMTGVQLTCTACNEAAQRVSEFTPEELHDLQSATESLAALCEEEFEKRGVEVVWRRNETDNGRHPVIIPTKERRADDMHDFRAPQDRDGPPFDSEGHPI